MPARSRRPSDAPAPQQQPTAPAQALLQGSNGAAQESMEEERSGIGGFLSGLIEKNLGADKVDDVATGAVDSGGDWLKGVMVDAASADDKKDARVQGGAGVDLLASDLNEKLVQSQLGETVSGYLADHPFLTGGVAVAGAAGYILSDQDIKFGTDFDIGDQHSLDISGEFGSTMAPDVDALRAGYTYDDGANRARLEGGSRFDSDEWDVKGEYQRRLGNGSSITLGATHRDKAGDTFSTLGANYDSKDLDAYARGSYDSKEDLGRFQAGFTKTGDGPDWKGSFDANSRGEWDAMLGVSDKSKDGNFEWFAGVGAGQGAKGGTEVQAKAGLSYRW